MPANGNVLAGPWSADAEDVDADSFRIVRAADKRPLAYMDKQLSPNTQDDLARLLTASPDLLSALREVFFAPQDITGAPEWRDKQWRAWRNRVGPLIAELWVNL